MDDSLLSPHHRVVDTPLLDPAERAEVVHMLTTICTLREKQTKSLPPVMINIYQAMALLHLVLKDHHKVCVGGGGRGAPGKSPLHCAMFWVLVCVCLMEVIRSCYLACCEVEGRGHYSVVHFIQCHVWCFVEL